MMPLSELRPSELREAAISIASVWEGLEESLEESLAESGAKNGERRPEPPPADPSHAGPDRPCSG
jgi:hypothetical protein